MLDSIGTNLIRLFQDYLPVFFTGMIGTLQIAGITVLFGSLLGTIIALAKISKVNTGIVALDRVLQAILQFILNFYTNLIRGTPLLLQLYLFYFILPELAGLEISKTTCIVIALIINSSAYVAEIIRAGIQGVDKGQYEAAKSLGMRNTQVMVRIIFPQAIKNILPALGNEFIMMVKETSLCSIFFVSDIMTSVKIVQSTLYISIEPLIVAALIYFVLTSVLSKAVNILEMRLSVSD